MVRKSGKHKAIAKSTINVIDNPCNDLHIAALEGAIKTVRNLLIEGEFDVNTIGERGFTALHFAANSGELEICKLLIENAADVTLQTTSGETALELMETHDFSSKKLFDKVKKLLRASNRQSLPLPLQKKENTKKEESEEETMPTNNEVEVQTRNSTRLQRSTLVRSRSSSRNFAKSVSTGDLLRSMKKDDVMRQKSKNKSSEDISCDIIPSDTESTDSAKGRSSFIANLARADQDTGSSEFGESIYFITPSEYDTEMEQNTPSTQGSVMTQDSCLDAKQLRTLTRNVSDVMNLISKNKMVTTQDCELISFPEFLPPRSLAYPQPNLKHASDSFVSIAPVKILHEVISSGDFEFYHEFMLLHRFFLSPNDLFILLLDKFKSSNDETMQKRILDLYLLWLSEYFVDRFHYPKVQTKLAGFLESISAIAPNLESIPQLKSLKITLSKSTIPKLSPISTTVRLCAETSTQLCDIPPNILAAEITLLYKEYLDEMTSLDLALFRRNVEIAIACPTVTRIYEMNDKLKRWVMSHILTKPKAEEQSQEICYFVALLESCLEFRNYQGAWIIAQALLSETISLLTTTWEFVPNKVVNEFKSMLNALTQSMNIEIFSYHVYKEQKAIIYNIDIILQEFIRYSKSNHQQINYQRLQKLNQFVIDSKTLKHRNVTSDTTAREFLKDIKPLTNKFIDIFTKSYVLSQDKKRAIQFFHSGVLCKIDCGKFSAVQGSLDDLISLILDEDLLSISSLLVEELFLAHRYYISSFHLLEILLKRFAEAPQLGQVYPSEADFLSRQFSFRRTRVMDLIRLWFAKYGKEVLVTDTKIEKALITFLRTNQMLSSDESFFFTCILRSFSKRKGFAQRRKSMIDAGKPFTLQVSWNKDILYKSSFPKYAARQFCLLDSAMYRKISPLEFLRDPSGDNELPNLPNRVEEWVQRFNRVSNWTTATILDVTDLTTRARAIKQFIRLARECLGMRNFNTSYAVISGLNHSTVQRLSKTWKALTPMTTNQFREVERVFDLAGGYKTYRHALKQVEPPIIPFLGIYTKDIYLLQEHNQTFKEDGSINFEKFSSLVSIIHDLIYFQTIPYRYEPDITIQQYLTDFTSVDEDKLYNSSMKIEPLKYKIKNPLYGQLVTPRVRAESMSPQVKVIDSDGKKLTRVINPVFDHPKLKKENNFVKRVASEPLHADNEVKREREKPRRSISRFKLSRRSKLHSKLSSPWHDTD